MTDAAPPSAYSDFVSQICHVGADYEDMCSEMDVQNITCDATTTQQASGGEADWMHNFLRDALPAATSAAPMLARSESDEWYERSAWLFSRFPTEEKAGESSSMRIDAVPAAAPLPQPIETILQRRLRARYSDLQNMHKTPPPMTTTISRQQEAEMHDWRAAASHVGPQDFSHAALEMSASPVRKRRRKTRSSRGAGEGADTGSDSTGSSSSATSSASPATPPPADVQLRHCAETGCMRYFCPATNCGKHFSTSGHARRHSRKHDCLLPFACPHQGCCATFTRRDNCTQHQRILHDHQLVAYRLKVRGGGGA